MKILPGNSWMQSTVRMFVTLLCMVATKGYTQISFQFTLDTTAISYQMGQPKQFDTVYGFLENLTGDSVSLGVLRSGVPQWNISTFISGNKVQIGPLDTNRIKLAPLETLPVVILMIPYPSSPDTNSVCFTVLSIDKSNEKLERCIPLYIWRPVGRVSEEALLSDKYRIYPNPFSTSAAIQLTTEQSSQQFAMIIFDGAGQEATGRFKVTITSDSIMMERSSAPAGTYYFQLHCKVSSQSSSIIGTGKFVVR